MKKYLFITLFFIYNTVVAISIVVPKTIESGLSVAIIDTSSNSVVYKYQANTPRLIASNMKILTSFLMLDHYGQNFYLSTKLQANSPINNNTLSHDLYLIGGADPSLTESDLVSLFTSSHLAEVAGDLVVDQLLIHDTVKSSENKPEPLAEYSVNPTGLIIDSNLTHIKIIKGKNNQLNYQLDTAPVNYKVTGKLKLFSQGRNKSCLNSFNQIVINKRAKSLYLSGKFPRECLGAPYPLNLFPPEVYNTIVLKRVLNKSKIRLLGKIKYTNIQQLESPLSINLEHDSSNLINLLKTMNLYSNNLYAKTFFMLLAKPVESLNGFDYETSKANYQKLLNKHLNALEMVAENGSGLSRSEKLSATNMALVLTKIYNSQFFEMFYQALPTPGREGTLKHDFLNYSGMLYAKTGTLNDAKNYSGYYLVNGKVYIVVFLLNQDNLNQSTVMNDYKQYIDHLLQQLN